MVLSEAWINQYDYYCANSKHRLASWVEVEYPRVACRTTHTHTMNEWVNRWFDKHCARRSHTINPQQTLWLTQNAWEAFGTEWWLWCASNSEIIAVIMNIEQHQNPHTGCVNQGVTRIRDIVHSNYVNPVCNHSAPIAAQQKVNGTQKTGDDSGGRLCPISSQCRCGGKARRSRNHMHHATITHQRNNVRATPSSTRQIKCYWLQQKTTIWCKLR